MTAAANTTAGVAFDDVIGDVRDANAAFKERLGQPFRFPATDDRAGWLAAIESAQNAYELAKGAETMIAAFVADIDESGHQEFEDAVTRLIDSSPKKPDGTRTLARTPAEKLAQIEPGYAAHKERLATARFEKGRVERWHSIAYQRLETLREVFRKL